MQEIDTFVELPRTGDARVLVGSIELVGPGEHRVAHLQTIERRFNRVQAVRDQAVNVIVERRRCAPRPPIERVVVRQVRIAGQRLFGVDSVWQVARGIEREVGPRALPRVGVVIAPGVFVPYGRLAHKEKRAPAQRSLCVGVVAESQLGLCRKGRQPENREIDERAHQRSSVEAEVVAKNVDARLSGQVEIADLPHHQQAELTIVWIGIEEIVERRDRAPATLRERRRDIDACDDRIPEQFAQWDPYVVVGVDRDLIFPLIDRLEGLLQRVVDRQRLDPERARRGVRRSGHREVRQCLAIVRAHVHLKDRADLHIVLERSGLLQQQPLVIFKKPRRAPLQSLEVLIDARHARDDRLPEDVGIGVRGIGNALEAVAEEALQRVDVFPNRARGQAVGAGKVGLRRTQGRAVGPHEVGSVSQRQLARGETAEPDQSVEICSRGGGAAGRNRTCGSPEPEGAARRRGEDFSKDRDEDFVRWPLRGVGDIEVLVEAVAQLLLGLGLGQCMRLYVLHQRDHAGPLRPQVVAVAELGSRRNRPWPGSRKRRLILTLMGGDRACDVP